MTLFIQHLAGSKHIGLKACDYIVMHKITT